MECEGSKWDTGEDGSHQMVCEYDCELLHWVSFYPFVLLFFFLELETLILPGIK